MFANRNLVATILIVGSMVVSARADEPAPTGGAASGGLPRTIEPPSRPQRVVRPAIQEKPVAEPSDNEAVRSGEMSEQERRKRAQLWERRIVREYGVGGRRSYRYLDNDGPIVVLPPVGVCGFTDPIALQWSPEEAYAQGRFDERNYSLRSLNEREMAERKQRVLTKHQQAVQSGLDALKAGDFARSVVALTLAAKLDHGDPACRLHLAQARLALGQYQDAALALRRALQLQPKLVYVDANFDSYYPAALTLRQLSAALSDWQKTNDSSAEVHFLRGYVSFQCGDFDAARQSFVLASDGLPGDKLTRDFLDVTKPAGGK